MDTFRSRLYDGWPLLSSSENQLRYDGPLPKTCPCTIIHEVLKGVTHENEFRVFVSMVGHALLGFGPDLFLKIYRPHHPWRLFFRCEAECGNIDSILIDSSSWSSFYSSWGARGQVLAWDTCCTSVELATFVGVFISNGSSFFPSNRGRVTHVRSRSHQERKVP